MMQDDRGHGEHVCVFNGIDSATGDYLVPPMPVREVLDVLRRRPFVPAPRAMMPGFDPCDLAESGWGVVVHREADPAVLDALEPLLRHRAAQAGARFRKLADADGYRSGEGADLFLSRFGLGPGPVNPKKLPYYLLIAGDPEAVPYSFQAQLDVQYAVGRIAFDSPAEYAAYARSVVAAETGAVRRPRRLTFFGVRNPGDAATALSADRLVAPLAESLAAEPLPGWEIETRLAAEATKERLTGILRQSPALLFTASHGLGFLNGDPAQLERQGSLLCQDWPGRGSGPVLPEHAVSAADIPDEAEVAGLVAFLFACHGAGTPRHDDFTHRNGWQKRDIAPRAFVSRLPCRLLTHPQGGALAVVGHVERAWSQSFLWRDHSQTEVFQSTLGLLCKGYPVGAAMEYFNQRFAELATLLTAELQKLELGEEVDAAQVSFLWTAHNDARSYVVVGDPAVRLAAA